MRCNNCGFPNRPEETECVKCHAPLDLNQANREEFYPIRNQENLKATIPEEKAFEDVEELICPKCGYPLRDKATMCPNCNYPVARGHNHSFVDYRQKKMESSTISKNHVTETINPFKIEVESEPTFILRPFLRNKEKKEIADLVYEGKEVLLNRGNTEEDNTSITSQAQALLLYSEGHWYIEDKSEQGTTFVRAHNKIELHDGDTLLLGNRLFEFHLPKDE